MECSYRSSEGDTCQFANSELSYEEYQGGTWCPFHLPASAKATWSEQQSGDLHKRIFDLIAQARPEGRADLRGVVIPAHITFAQYNETSRMLPPIDFSRATFLGQATFNRTIFGKSEFVSTIFCDEVHFLGAEFYADANFDGAEFRKEAHFERMKFRESANFKRIHAVCNATFAGTTFSKRASFRHSQFDNKISFSQATFMDEADFSPVVCHNRADFIATRFRGDVEFQDSIFHDEADFALGPLRGIESDGTPIGSFRRANFSRVMFRGLAIFTDRVFLDSTRFRDAVFSYAPQFHNGKLHPHTDFHAKFLDRRSQEAVSAYRWLKSAMGQNRARGEEALFYAFEQEALRAQPETPRSVKLFSWSYSIISRYGSSLMRPLFCLFATTALFMVVYMAIALASPNASFRDVGFFALEQVIRPFSLWSRGYDVSGSDWVAKNLSILRVLSLLQGLLSLSFVALFLLALRWQFKRE